jgi:hypothetical protein
METPTAAIKPEALAEERVVHRDRQLQLHRHGAPVRAAAAAVDRRGRAVADPA